MPVVSQPIIATLFLAAASAAMPASAQEQVPAQRTSETRIQLAQLTIEQRVIIRIPTIQQRSLVAPRNTTVAPPAPSVPVEIPTFREAKGPKCIKLKQIRGAVISLGSGIMMLTDKEERFRTHFNRMCRAADFYAGFYIEPNKEGTLCAGRDVLHARNGSSCEIERFSRLVADD